MIRPSPFYLAATVAVLAVACTPSTTPVASPKVPTATRVHDIQGDGHRSPLEGERVDNVEGVVTAVLSGKRASGFWMQDIDGDGDDATSEGMFVLTTDMDVAVSIGDLVSVSGTVEEPGREGSLTTTQISTPVVRVVSRDATLPAPVRVGVSGRSIPDRFFYDDDMQGFDPRVSALDFWESLEGMRIELRDPIVVGPSTSYGDIVVLADGGRGAKVRSSRGGLVIQEDDFNPERIVIEPRLASVPSVNIGDRFDGGITAIVDDGFGSFRLLNTSPLPRPVLGSTPPEVTALRGDSDHLTIATYNVLNLSATDSDDKFRRVAESIARNLGAPDVVALQEMQDDSGAEDDGVVSAAMTFGKLIDAIVEAGGPRYDFRQIDPANNRDGGRPGGNIRVGLLFEPSRISFVDRGEGGAEDSTHVVGNGGDTRLTLSPGRIDPADPCFTGGENGSGTRKSLAAELRYGDRTLFLIVNHLSSKGGDDALFGTNQPPALHSETQRTCQAEVVGRFAAGILARDPDAAVVVLGDMNEHEFRPPIRRLAETSGLTNLIERVPLPERYTFVYIGNSQILDHVLVSPGLLNEGNPEIDIVHINIDRAAPDAASDHDPVLVRLMLGGE